jgi:hypothetical protein
MPAIFFLSLPPSGETGTGAEKHSKAECGDGLGYSGHLSFDGGFDRFGFTPQRVYSDHADTGEADQLDERPGWDS